MATYSALPATLNLVATVGNDFALSLTVTENGSPWVATGATLATDIIDSSGTVVATDFTTAASTGTVSLSLTDANTTTLGVGVYSYRLSVTKSSLTRDWIAGTLSIVEAGQGGTSTSSASLSISNSAVTLSLTSLVAPLAENISVADAGGYYAGDTVEEVLAEIGNAEELRSLPDLYGYDLVPRDFVTGTTVVTLVKDKPVWKEFTAPFDMVCTGMSMASSTTVSAGLTFARFSLHHVGRRYGQTGYLANSYTILARSANDTTLFNSASTVYTKSWDTTDGWPAAVRLVKGERYAVGYQIIGTTAPTALSNGTAVRPQVVALAVVPYMGGSAGGLGTLTDLVAYWNGGSLNAADPGGYLPWYNLSIDPDGTTARPFDTALIGDSYVATYAHWIALGNAQAGSKLLPTYNAGVGGETTTQMLARISSVTARSPRVVVVAGGLNDVVASVSSATIIANLDAIADACTAAGAKVILCTILPTSGMTAPQLVVLAAVNAWIMAQVAPVYPSDTGRAMSTGDGVTADATKFLGDAVHPNTSGAQAMANVLDDTITTVAAVL